MMDDLISRQAAIEAIQEPYDEAKKLWTMVQDVEIKTRMGQAIATYLEIVKMLNKLPPAEPERQQGEWNREVLENTSGGTYYVWRCSVCGFAQLLPLKMNYCPNCGADMRGEKDGD